MHAVKSRACAFFNILGCVQLALRRMRLTLEVQDQWDPGIIQHCESKSQERLYGKTTHVVPHQLWILIVGLS
jgi:hypothetical protein